MLRVTLLHANRQRFAGMAAQVILPGEEGEVAVLNFHAPMLCVLGEGAVQIDEARFSVRSGIARVERNVVTIVTH